MQILNITNRYHTFGINSSGVKPRMAAVQTQKPDAKQGLYDDIDEFLSKKIDKRTYLKRLNDMVEKLDNFDCLSEEEKKYIYSIYTTADDLGGADAIPLGYITKLMLDLQASGKNL